MGRTETRIKRSSRISRSSKDHKNNLLDGNFQNYQSTTSSAIKRNKTASDSSIIAKIGDWGSARASLSGSKTMTHGVGTACWLAPEVIKFARCSKYSDVYSFSIVLWELATQEEVYQGLETTQIIAGVANDKLRPPVPEDCLWKDIMVKCWDENPQNRLSFEKISQELKRILSWVKSKNRPYQSYNSSSDGHSSNQSSYSSLD